MKHGAGVTEADTLPALPKLVFFLNYFYWYGFLDVYFFKQNSRFSRETEWLVSFVLKGGLLDWLIWCGLGSPAMAVSHCRSWEFGSHLDHSQAVSTVPVGAEGRGFLQRSWPLAHAGRLKKLGSDDMAARCHSVDAPVSWTWRRTSKGKSISFSDLFLTELPAEATAHRYDGTFHLN